MQKTAHLKIKAAGPKDDLEEGQFLAYASVFGNIDSYGDKVVKGAFAETLKEWNSGDAVIPLLYGHDMRDPNNNIGHVIEASEDDHGLLVKGQIDLDGGNGPQVYRLVKGARVSQMSFAYDVLEGAWIDTEEESFYELRKLKLYEVSIVPIGANQETELLAVKAAAEHSARFAEAVKAGRVLSAKNETTLREAVASLDAASKSITDVLAAVSDEGDQEKGAQPAGPATPQEPTGKTGEATGQEPSLTSPADHYLAVISIHERN